MYTKNELIEQAKQAQEGILDCRLPMVTQHFGEFADKIGLDIDTYYHLDKYINGVSYAAKQDLFESLGFTVKFMTLSALKVSQYSRAHNGVMTVNESFVDGDINEFIFEVEQGMKNLYFILSYPVAGDPLAEHTIDKEQLAREEKRKAAFAGFLSSIKKNRETKTDNNGLF